MTRTHILKSLFLTGIFLTVAILSDSALAADPKPAPEGPKAERPEILQERFDTYISDWLKMPALIGRSVSESQSDFSYKPIYGRATVVVFLASSCIACQEHMERIKRLEDRYSQLFTDFIYVFVSDSNKDAMDFAKEFKISDTNLVHANDELLMLYKNPRLPSIFIGDRHGWIADFHMDVSAKEISLVENFLKLMTAI